MTKQEAIEELKKRGFTATLDRGVVTILVDKVEFSHMKKLEQVFREIGYKSSWGIVPMPDSEERQHEDHS